MSKVSLLIQAAKASPVKTGLIVAGTAAVVVGGVYAVKKMRAKPEENPVQATKPEEGEVTKETTEETAKAEKDVVSEQGDKKSNKQSNKQTA